MIRSLWGPAPQATFSRLLRDPHGRDFSYGDAMLILNARRVAEQSPVGSA